MAKVREGYKETEIGVIPEEWEWRKLKNLCTKITDGTHRTPNYTESGIPFLRVADIQSKYIDWNNVKYISEDEHKELIKRCNPEIGDILYSKNGTIGIPKIIDWDREFSIFVSLCLIKVKENAINKKYLEQFLKSDNCLNQIKLRAKQGTVTNLHLEEIKELDIAMPPEHEQQRIAEILSATDEHIEKLDKTIEDYQLLKKGMMKKLLTEGIGHTEFKETEIGRIPKEWEVKHIGECCNTMSGGTPSRKISEFYNDGDIPWVKTGELNKKYIFTSEEKITKLAIQNSSAKLADKNSILIAMYGATIGKCSILKVQATTNQACCIINPMKDNGYFEYLYYYLNFDKDNLITKAAGGAQPNISQQIIKLHIIPLPPLAEQQQIASILSEIDNKIDQYQQQRQDFIQLKKALMEQLLTGKIRVKQ